MGEDLTNHDFGVALQGYNVHKEKRVGWSAKRTTGIGKEELAGARS